MPCLASHVRDAAVLTSHAAVGAADNLAFEDFSHYPDPSTMGAFAAVADLSPEQEQQQHQQQQPQPPHLPSLRLHHDDDDKMALDQALSSPTTAAAAHHHRRGLTADEVARLAAEEDKRRRNTAASARFRVKKKQREQALEKSTKEMTDKIGHLQGRIQHLEMENKWLKNLVIEKNKSRDTITVSPDTDGSESSVGSSSDGKKSSSRRS